MNEHPREAVLMAAATDVGKVRKHNEDYFYFSKRNRFFIVCDGMGGHNSGALASKLAGVVIHESLTKPELLDLDRACADLDPGLPVVAKRLIAGIRLANRRVYQHTQHSKQARGMGTTVVAAVIDGGLIYTAHVGDSRIYRLQNGRLEALTKDHSWLNELIEDREIDEKQAQAFKKKNVLTRALGIYPTVKIDLRIDRARPQDLYLLCTDGLHNALTDELILSILSADHGSLQKSVDKLVQNAKLLDGSDNITAGVMLMRNGPSNSALNRPVQMTVSDEAERVSIYLDRVIKTAYRKAPARKKRKFPLAAVWAVIFFAILAGFFIWRGSSAQKNLGASIQAALLNTNPVPPQQAQRPAAAKDLAPAGRLVLVQVRDGATEEILHRIEGVRVLDDVRFLPDGMPLYPGRFAWAFADSLNAILYKNAHIHVVPLSRINRAEPVRNSAAANSAQGSTETGGTIADAPKPGKVYLIGNFDAQIYRESRIYINESLLGPLDNYIDDGFYLRPGRYEISIRDAEGRRLRRKLNVRIQSGKIRAVEM